MKRILKKHKFLLKSEQKCVYLYPKNEKKKTGDCFYIQIHD